MHVTHITVAAMSRKIKKEIAIDMFGGVVKLARAIGVTPQAISRWPDEIDERLSDRVIAACVRSEMDPAPILEAQKEAA